MAQATLAVTMPDQTWIRQVSVAHPDATFQVLATVTDAESGFALVRIAGPDVPAVLEDVDGHSQITELTLARWNGNEATVHFETTAPLLLFSARESGLPIELPVEIRDGEATLELTGSRERLSELVAQLDQFGFRYRIEQVYEHVDDDRLLSERQLEVVVAAVESGYYDTPRRCSLTDLSDRLGIAKSTCSETLHRAEEAIVKRFVDDRLTNETGARVDETGAPADRPADESATTD